MLKSQRSWANGESALGPGGTGYSFEGLVQYQMNLTIFGGKSYVSEVWSYR